MTNRRALIIYNDLLIKPLSGTLNRVTNILKILKEINIDVDQLTKNKEYQNVIQNNDKQFINNIIFVTKSKLSLWRKLLIKVKTNIQLTKREKNFFKNINIKPYRFNLLINKLKTKINVNNYDYVISVNSENAFWIDAFGKKTKKILLMEDVMFNQFRDTAPKNLVDRYLDDYKNYEEKIVNKFDYIFGISQDEINIFKNEKNKDKFIYLPAFMDKKNIEQKEYQYDIIYVAHNNPHNIKACKWFLEYVYPKLKNLRILFIGKICETIENKQEYNIDYIDYVENLDDAYNKSKIAVCPMFSGTGLKIKVVEAFAYGKPVICNKMGVVGQPNLPEIDNKAIFISDNSDEFVNYIYNLLEDKELYNNASKFALKYFDKYFSTEKVKSKLLSVFENNDG